MITLSLVCTELRQQYAQTSVWFDDKKIIAALPLRRKTPDTKTPLIFLSWFLHMPTIPVFFPPHRPASLANHTFAFHWLAYEYNDFFCGNSVVAAPSVTLLLVPSRLTAVCELFVAIYVSIKGHLGGDTHTHTCMHAHTPTHNHNTLWTSCDGSNIIYITTFKVLREDCLQAGRIVLLFVEMSRCLRTWTVWASGR